LAVLSSCTKVMPPFDLIASMPSEPSLPVPERRTPIARLSMASASELNSTSTGMCILPSSLRGVTVMRPLSTASEVFGVMT
jgi:hypothetical protein